MKVKRKMKIENTHRVESKILLWYDVIRLS